MHSEKQGVNNKSRHTSHQDIRTVEEWNISPKYVNMDDEMKFNPYRLEGYWHEKGKLYQEEDFRHLNALCIKIIKMFKEN